MKLRRRIWLAVAVLVPLVAVGLLWLHHYRSKNALEDYKRQLLAAGEKLTIAELIPKPVDSERDGTDLFSKAAMILNAARGPLNTNYAPAMRMVAPGRAMIGWQQPDLRDGDATNSWEEVREQLAACAEAFELLHRLIGHPLTDSPPEYLDGFKMRLPRLAQRKTAVQRFNAAVVSSLHEGDAAAAVTHLRAMLALTQVPADERLLISQMVRFALAAITLAATWEVLQSPHATETQLAAVQRAWEEMEFADDMAHAMEMERAMLLQMAEEMRKSGKVFEMAASPFGSGFGGSSASGADSWSGQALEFAQESWERTKSHAHYVTWRVAWASADELTALQAIQATVGALREARSCGVFRPAMQNQKNELSRLGLSDDSAIETSEFLGFVQPATRNVLSVGVSVLHNSTARVLQMEAGRRLTVAAIAWKRFHLRHGSPPAGLSALTPEFLGSVPRDPVDGQPLRYRREADGTFLLYSVGEDGVDDGGNPKPANEAARARHWQTGRDWVWPRPATPEQLAAYYEELARRKP